MKSILHRLARRHMVYRHKDVGVVVICGSRVRRRAPVTVTFIPCRDDGTYPVDEPRPGEDVPFYRSHDIRAEHFRRLLRAATTADAVAIMKMTNDVSHGVGRLA